MINIETYLIGKCKNKKVDGKFYRLTAENAFNINKNAHCIEGAVIIKNEDEYILDYKYWDVVDFLYVLIIDCLYELEINKKGECGFCFPDQPIYVKMKLKQNIIVIYIADVEYKVKEEEFVKALIYEATYALTIFKETIGQSYYEDTFYKIKCIEEKIAKNKV